MRSLKEKYRKWIDADPRERKILLKRLAIRYSLVSVFWLPCIAIIWVLYIIRPFIKIRLGMLVYSRVGHLASNTELYLRRLNNGNQKQRSMTIFFSGTPANYQLLKMIKRKIPVLAHPVWPFLYPVLRASSKKSAVRLDLPWDHNEYYEFNNFGPQLSFTDEEEAYGRQVLAQVVGKPNCEFVCMFARDSAYLNELGLEVQEYRTSYRNSDIQNYVFAAEYLSSLGIKTVRMGQIVESQLNVQTPHIIDYASIYRTDFSDIYLSSTCKFFLGCTCGIVAMAYIFNVPCAFVNVVPIRPFPISKHDLFIPKKIWSKKERRVLTLSETMWLGNTWRHADTPEDVEYQAIENTSAEIMGLVKEMNQRLDGRWVETAEDIELQTRFRTVMPADGRFLGTPSRIGAEFLRENQASLR